MGVPFISKEKRDESLKKARYYKIQRSEIKQSIKNGHMCLSDVFESDEKLKDIVANIKIVDIVKSLPGIGEVKAKKILKNLSISDKKTLKGLGEKQKENFKKYFGIK
ncbi:hypothetical protein LLG07_07895 [bacterium]|nr:hypothetical protein [bacterium]